MSSSTEWGYSGGSPSGTTEARHLAYGGCPIEVSAPSCPCPCPGRSTSLQGDGAESAGEVQTQPISNFPDSLFHGSQRRNAAAYSTEERMNSSPFLNTRCDLFSVDLSFPRLQPFPRTFNLARKRKCAVMTEYPAWRMLGAESPPCW